MKILFLLPHIKIAGGTRVVLSYARELQALGHEIEVLVCGNSRRQAFFNTLLKKRPLWFGKLPCEVRFRFTTDGSIQKWLATYRGDVVIADSWTLSRHLEAVQLDPRIKRFHLVQHDERLYHGHPEFVSAVYQNSLKKICVSQWIAERLKKELGVTSSVIPNTIDKDVFNASVHARNRSSEVRILVLDHPYDWKGTNEAVHLVKHVKQKNQSIKLIGIGAKDSQTSPEYDEFHFGLSGAALASVYAASDIFLCTSWDEGFGLPALEAMACGAALVTYDNGGSREYAFHNKTALVAPHRNIQVLQEYLEQLIVDKELRERISQAGITFTKNLPAWSDQAKKLKLLILKH